MPRRDRRDHVPQRPGVGEAVQGRDVHRGAHAEAGRRGREAGGDREAGRGGRPGVCCRRPRPRRSSSTGMRRKAAAKPPSCSSGRRALRHAKPGGDCRTAQLRDALESEGESAGRVRREIIQGAHSSASEPSSSAGEVEVKVGRVVGGRGRRFGARGGHVPDAGLCAVLIPGARAEEVGLFVSSRVGVVDVLFSFFHFFISFFFALPHFLSPSLPKR